MPLKYDLVDWVFSGGTDILKSALVSNTLGRQIIVRGNNDQLLQPGVPHDVRLQEVEG